MSNNFNNINGNNDLLPQHFVNYINYELRLFEEITDKKFFFDTFRNDGFELNVWEQNEDDKRIIYRASNLYQFIERLFMIREYLIKNFDNKITTSATFHDWLKKKMKKICIFFDYLLYDLSNFRM